MQFKKSILFNKGILAALAAALLFGAGTPVAKLLLSQVNPWLLAGLLYLGSGLGLMLYRLLTHAQTVRLPKQELWWFVAAIVSGGIVAPVLLMWGLSNMPAAGASLLLNMETIFTAFLAWFAFKENFDRRLILGMALIVTGALVLTWSSQQLFSGLWSSLAVLAACFAWGLDNNLTRKLSLTDATWIASIKGFTAGLVNLILAFMIGAKLPAWPYGISAMIMGFFAYGISLSLFVFGLRELGTARTSAYFSVAPFFGALLAIAMGEPLTLPLCIAGAFMVWGVWLHLSERHEHEHTHLETAHSHEHSHDAHHRHHHTTAELARTHTHHHQHVLLTHKHPHYPDSHHQHHH